MTTDPVPTSSTVAQTNAMRLQRQRRITAIGAGVALALALLTGVAGGTGAAGAAVFLLVMAATCAVAATFGAITAVRDDLRDIRVSRARMAWTVGLFFAAAGFMAMTAGVGG